MANDDVQTASGAAVPTSSGDEPYVVGIGASAGGLAALRTLLGAMPRAPGFACVVVVHLAPEHESHLVDLLQPYTQLRVQQVRDTTRLERNNVYLVPPNANLEAIDTHLRLAELEPRRAERAPIDHFLRTLARVHDGRAVGVILTGSGSDGSLGLRKVKERGGLTIAQDPSEAEYDSMPRSAIQTGTVDQVLCLRDIPGAIASFCSGVTSLGTAEEPVDAEEHRALEQIIELLHARSGHDFKQFRRSVLLRKIGRRMRLQRVSTLHAYLDVLRSHDGEPRALCRDLLFAVTDFFDDAALFARIEREVLPALFERKRVPGSRVRVWTIGCSTGEQAYSLAMLLVERADDSAGAPLLQVFASDLSPDALVQAREGLYPKEVAATVSRERLKRFFTAEGDRYRVDQRLRSVVLFAEHNVLGDPPYAHTDLIVCRGVLSDLRPEVRRAVLGMFYYSLEPEGQLIVGANDVVDEPLLFNYEDRRAGVLRRIPGAPRAIPLSAYWHATRAANVDGDAVFPAQEGAMDLASVHHRMMERYTPPSLLLFADDSVAYYSASAGRYVCMPGGEPTRDVYKVLRAPLPTALRPLVERARRDGLPCRSEPFTLDTESGQRSVVLRVEPPHRNASDLTLVVIDELREPLGEAETAPVLLISTLQGEIDRILHRLRGVIEQHARDRGDLESSKDRLQGSNEQLGVILEQLEASKEEIQVANEELTTLDIENQRRLAELSQVSGVLRHLLQSTGIATLFLDRELRILRFTPQLGELLNVRDVDVGRPVVEITSRLDYDDLVADAHRTLAHGTTVDREVESHSGRWYLARMLPYETPAEHVEGVVLTFVDITDRKQAERELRDADRRKDEFLALLAHELRNPLAPIVAGIELLQQAKDKPQLLEQVTATMARQARQLVRLVDDLLELSRVSGGRLRLRKTRVPLRDVLRDAVASVRPTLERQRHELRMTLPDEPIELEADSARLTQVFANLLSNAARYTPAGGRIGIEASREGGDAVVTVSDNGVGIPASALARVFEMFYQCDDDRPTRGGLGIGLTLARSLVEMHGGTITAASAGSNRGSEFKVRLPIADRPAAVVASEQKTDSRTLGGHRVLIVDDNTDAARTLGMLVETLGRNEVHVASNGSDALRIAEERRPDIVLLDLKMPGMDGYEVARRLRNESWGRHLTLVAVTGWALEDHKRRSRDAGFDRHLTKPADVAALAAVLSAPIGAPPSA